METRLRGNPYTGITNKAAGPAYQSELVCLFSGVGREEEEIWLVIRCVCVSSGIVTAGLLSTSFVVVAIVVAVVLRVINRSEPFRLRVTLAASFEPLLHLTFAFPAVIQSGRYSHSLITINSEVNPFRDALSHHRRRRARHAERR